LGEFYDAKFTGCDLALSENPVHNMTFVQSTASKLPFPDASFDLVVCMDVLEHIPKMEREKAVEEIMRVAFGRSKSEKLKAKSERLNIRKNLLQIRENPSEKLASRAIIIGYPCDQEAVKLSKKMYKWFKKRGSGTAKWMEEHTKFGLPNSNFQFSILNFQSKTKNINSKKSNRTIPHQNKFDVGHVSQWRNDRLNNITIKQHNNENLLVCELLLKLEENGHWLKLERVLFAHFRPLVEFFLRGMNRGKCYRRIWIIEK
jgi:hypothetical protein